MTSITGILFWYTICELLEPALGMSKICNCISNNTFHIMETHIFGFFIVNFFITSVSRCIGIKLDDAYLFSVTHNAYTIYPFEKDIMKVVYVVFGVSFGTFVGIIVKRINLFFRRKIYDRHD